MIFTAEGWDDRTLVPIWSGFLQGAVWTKNGKIGYSMLETPTTAASAGTITPQILIAGRDEIYIEGLRRLLPKAPAGPMLELELHVDVETIPVIPQLLIVQMDVTHPPEQCRELRQLFPAADLLAFGSVPSREMLSRGIQQGIGGFIGMGSPCTVWVEALQCLLKGRTWFDPGVRPLLRSFQTQLLLSGREREVLCHAAAGLGDKEIAGLLGLECSTVNTHLKRVYRKLGVHSRMAAVALAAERGEFAVNFPVNSTFRSSPVDGNAP